MRPVTRISERGFTVLVVAVSLLVIIGIAGLAVDLGRTYYVKSELQAFSDAAAIHAVQKLDGTSVGISAAIASVTSVATGTNAMKWDIGTKTISNRTVTFAKGDSAHPNQPDSSTWTPNPGNPDAYRFAQVRATADVPLTFMLGFNALMSQNTAGTMPVSAVATAAQALITGFTQGLLPFSPFAPVPSQSDDFGFVPGSSYSLRWGSMGHRKPTETCGDSPDAWYAPASDYRGFWGDTSASAIRAEIITGQQLNNITIGARVPLTGGGKSTEGDALDERVREDSDSTSTTYAAYQAGGLGNGRRIIGVPLNDAANANMALGIGAFFLMRAGIYNLVTSESLCAEYIGPYVQGTLGPGAGSGTLSGNTGGYVLRLVF